VDELAGLSEEARKVALGRFRLLNRLLAQMERILEIDALREVSKAAVEAARESLVNGQVVSIRSAALSFQ
jgi:hypothetical protein